MTPGPVIETERFTLRPLAFSDANADYLNWLTDPSAGFIAASRTTGSLEALRAYVADKIAQPDLVFLAIVDRSSGRHVGNLKFEPVDRVQRYAVFGILIGDAAFRGKGVAAEVIGASAQWLKGEGIDAIWLGVDQENEAAIGAYRKAGFHVGSTPHLQPSNRVLHMVLRL